MGLGLSVELETFLFNNETFVGCFVNMNDLKTFFVTSTFNKHSANSNSAGERRNVSTIRGKTEKSISNR